MGDQYLETSKLLLETLINNNSNAGFGSTQEAYEEMCKNVLEYNGDFGIRNLKVLLKRLCEVKEIILKEYHEKY